MANFYAAGVKLYLVGSGIAAVTSNHAVGQEKTCFFKDHNKRIAILSWFWEASPRAASEGTTCAVAEQRAHISLAIVSIPIDISFPPMGITGTV